MKLFKFIATFALIIASNATQAKSSSNANSESSYPKLGQACLVELTNSKTTRFINVNTIRFVEVDEEEPNTLVVSILGNHKQITGLKTSYSSKEEAIKALKMLVKDINKCDK